MQFNDIKVEVSGTDNQRVAAVILARHPSSFSPLRDQVIENAKAVANSKKEQGIGLLLSDDLASAITLAAFAHAQVDFKIYQIKFSPTSQTNSFDDYIASLGLKSFIIEPDLSNNGTFDELEALQAQATCQSVETLLQIWATCQFDEFAVMPGNFTAPLVSRAGQFKRWECLAPFQIPLFQFLKNHEGLFGFLNCTPELIYSQIESKANALARQLSAENLFLPTTSPSYRRELAREFGFGETEKFFEFEVRRPAYREALKAQGRSANESFAVIEQMCAHAPRPPELINNIEDRGWPATQSETADGAAFGLKKLAQRTDILPGGTLTQCDGADSEFVAAFPTLISTHQFKGDNSALLDFARGAKFVKNLGNSNSRTDVLSAPELGQLRLFFEDSVRTYFEKMGYSYESFEITQSWLNKTQFGEFHHRHNHQNSFLSGVFFITDGGGGNTVFFKENEQRCLKIDTYKETSWNVSYFEFKPQKGRLLLFPSHLDHQTRTHTDKESIRYTLSFNVMVRGEVGTIAKGTWLKL